MLCEKYNLQHDILLKHETEAENVYEANAYRFEKRYIEALCIEAGLCDEHRKMLLDFMDFAEQDPDILRFMWLYYYLQFETDECFMDNLWGNGLGGIPTPEICETFSPGMLKSVVYLLAADHFRKFMREFELPDSYIEEYFSNYRRFSETNKHYHNTYGLCKGASFVYTYAYPFILRIGRLCYQVLSFRDYCEVYEDACGNRLIIALPNYTYNTEGHQDEASDFRPIYRLEGNKLTAHTFDEKGLLCPMPQVFDLSGLTKVLSPSDKVVTIHIPGDGKLTPESVDQSLADAEKMLSRCFLKYHYKAIVCQTWFLDSQLQEVLPRTSNMLKFQEKFDLVMTGDDRLHSLFEKIFQVNPTDLDNLVPQNSFQQKMLDRAKAGKKMYRGFGILKNQTIRV